MSYDPFDPASSAPPDDRDLPQPVGQLATSGIATDEGARDRSMARLEWLSANVDRATYSHVSAEVAYMREVVPEDVADGFIAAYLAWCCAHPAMIRAEGRRTCVCQDGFLLAEDGVSPCGRCKPLQHFRWRIGHVDERCIKVDPRTGRAVYECPDCRGEAQRLGLLEVEDETAGPRSRGFV